MRTPIEITRHQTKEGLLEAGEGAEGKADKRAILSERSEIQRVVIQAIISHAQEKSMKIREVQDQVEEYTEELVTFFNMLSYYKIGY